MKLLYLLRHAKSSWDDPVMPDKDRPLAARGRHATTLLAEHLQAKKNAPALVLCSSARRAVETLDRIKQALEIDVQTSIEDELYRAHCEELAHRLHQFPSTTPSIMLIGALLRWTQIGRVAGSKCGASNTQTHHRGSIDAEQIAYPASRDASCRAALRSCNSARTD